MDVIIIIIIIMYSHFTHYQSNSTVLKLVGK